MNYEFDFFDCTRYLNLASQLMNKFYVDANTRNWREIEADIEADAKKLRAEYDDEFLDELLTATVRELHRQSTFNSKVRAGKW